ncbi:DUF2721 domain-containing protein [Ferrimonas balearica]|uniref:DUF2721 domain-containing protein n=1 Tax=Ferrimonas balearica TaxID=44012 RepID=UPI001C99740B|nr:DUF2721 domain-containing protein [Ferrimonas balearica]MBY5922945.1 DUF2721 domain-containing protein [Ferrimonas balearica]MBY5997678.1 DUF2721 domain-containing protein [Ferrimonas balearica]
MPLSLTTPALLFSAISLLLLAYTNRFLSLAALIRSLANQAADCGVAEAQIANLRHRIRLIRWMQEAGVLSFTLCVLSMLLIYLDKEGLAVWSFGASLALLLYSLVLSVVEIRISQKALDIFLDSLKR